MLAAEPLAAADAAAPRLTGRSLSQAFGLAIVRGYHRRAAELNRWAVCSSFRKRGHERRLSFNVTRIDSSTSSWFFSGSASCQRHIITPQRTPRARPSKEYLHLPSARRVLHSGSAAIPPSPRPTGAALPLRLRAPRQKGCCVFDQAVSTSPASDTRRCYVTIVVSMRRAITHTGRVIRARPNKSLQRTRLRRGSTGRSLSQAFGLATVRGYHRRAAELNR
jgi:hypothetical protein